ncbi:MAG: hypothetical protein RR588_03390 [Solibacillus sp.]
MPKFLRCGHYNETCPCLECDKYADVFDCPISCQQLGIRYAVDTEKLCDKAKKYCESNRDNDDLEIYTEDDI